MTLTEMNAFRSTARTPIVEKVVESLASMNITRIPGTNKYYVPTSVDGVPCYVGIEFSVPQWQNTEKVTAFDLNAEVAKAEAEVAAKAEKAAIREANKSAKSAPARVDNAAFDELVITNLLKHGDPVTAADFFEEHEWGEYDGKAVTKNKVISALTRLHKVEKVKKVSADGKNCWTVA